MPDFLNNHDLKLIFFGGKGGVGKTTMAAATAVYIAESRKAEKVLIISTDPAHSLSDSLGHTISDQVTNVPLRNGVQLYAREMDARKLLEIFKKKNDKSIKKIADRGTFFDQEDIGRFFELSLPGMDEVMAIIEISFLVAEKNYDVIIVDTAPTGHTLRMLDLPGQMDQWIKLMNLMLEKHRFLSEQFSRKKYVKDQCDIFLDNLSRDIQRVRYLMADTRHTCFVPVTLAEPMVINETKKLTAALQKKQVPVKEIIVNRHAETNNCSFCAQQEKRQIEHIKRIKTVFKRYDLVFVNLFPKEISGLKNLYRLGDFISKSRFVWEKKQQKISRDANTTGLSKDLEKKEEKGFEKLFKFGKDTKIIFLGGKGGVGKTSMASAISLNLAKAYPDKKILIFSTDPAHSLSDSFDFSIGDTITPILPNLYALEIDADRLFKEFKEKFKNDIQTLFDRFLKKNMDVKFDRDVMTELMSMAPPGLDEIMALDSIMDLMKNGEYDIIVIDSSPTGHLLRFLELPDLIREWLNAFFKLLIKYKGAIKLTLSAEKALALSKSIRRVKEILTDQLKTSFIAVTIPEKMGLLESKDLLDSLERSGIRCNYLVINMIYPKNMNCAFCREKGKEESKIRARIYSQFSDVEIVEIEKYPFDVRGLKSLEKMTKKWKLECFE